jgi:hypothetical protein
MNTFGHHNLLVKSFFLLQKQLEIKEWICEWVLRINKHRKDKIPDGLLMLHDGTNLALEVETSYKTKDAWRTVVTLYRYDIEKISRYDMVLVIALDTPNYESIKHKLYSIAPEFCARSFILTEINMLAQGLCFYQSNTMSLREAFSKLEEKGQNDGKGI